MGLTSILQECSVSSIVPRAIGDMRCVDFVFESGVDGWMLLQIQEYFDFVMIKAFCNDDDKLVMRFGDNEPLEMGPMTPSRRVEVSTDELWHIHDV